MPSSAGQSGGARSSRRRTTARRAGVLFALAAVLSGVVGYGIRRTQHDLHVVTTDLRRVDRALQDEGVAVQAAGERRRTTEATLDRTLVRLRRERDVRRDVRAEFDALSIELGKRREQLRSTSSDLGARQKQLDLLNFCLVGVAKAMNEAAYDADSRAIETLRTIAPVCALATGAETRT
jgi:hypothetical protein